MIDSVQNHRLDALERAFATLTGGSLTQYVQPPTPAPTINHQQDARIAALESSVLALSNSVTLLNQQIAGLTGELQRQANATNMIHVSPPGPTVDAAQDERLDGIDDLVQSLSKNVADYNQQMVDLIAQYKTIKPYMFTAKATKAGAKKMGW